MNAAAHQVAFELRRLAQEFAVFVIRAEPHHAFHPGAIVPAAVEHHDFAARGQVFDIALEVPLAAFDIAGLFQRDHARAARVQMLHEALDRAALARGIPPFEQDHHALLRFLHPLLQFQQFGLEDELLALVILAQHLVLVGIAALAPVVRQFVAGLARSAGRLGQAQVGPHPRGIVGRGTGDDRIHPVIRAARHDGIQRGGFGLLRGDDAFTGQPGGDRIGRGGGGRGLARHAETPSGRIRPDRPAQAPSSQTKVPAWLAKPPENRMVPTQEPLDRASCWRCFRSNG